MTHLLSFFVVLVVVVEASVNGKVLAGSPPPLPSPSPSPTTAARVSLEDACGEVDGSRECFLTQERDRLLLRLKAVEDALAVQETLLRGKPTTSTTPSSTILPPSTSSESSSSMASLNATERAILLQFYQESDGPNWRYPSNTSVNQTWSVGENYCEWLWVVCNAQNRVVGLSFPDKPIGMEGFLFSTLSGLALLETLSIPNQLLSAPYGIDFLCSIPLLSVVNLGGNSVLDTSMPTCWQPSNVLTSLTLNGCLMTVGPSGSYGLQHLTQLTHLDLSNNVFDGPFPPAISALTQLTFLNLSSCGLNSSVPTGFAALSALTVLDLSNNQLSFILPNAFLSMGLLSHVDLSNNAFSGLAPSLTNLDSLTYLSLAGNFFSGSLPVPSPQAPLREYSVYANRFTGNLESLDGLSSRPLTTFNVSRNALSGTLPEWLGTLNDLTTLGLAENSLCGPLPANLINLVALRTLNVSHNLINGSLPSLTPFYNLVILDASSNELEGRLPLPLPPPLAYLDLSNNQLSGDLGYWSYVSALYYLDLSSNQLSGTIPESFGDLSSLEYLSIGFNDGITGAFPSSLFETMTELTYLSAFNTKISGSIPESIGSCTKLVYIQLQSCNLTGSIPPALGHATALTTLNLAVNSLSGSIPPALGSLRSLTSLFLHVNQLEGTIPHSLLSIPTLQVIDLSNNRLEGSIPFPGSASSILVFNAFSNFLSGDVVIDGMPLVSELRLSNNQLNGSMDFTALGYLEVLDVSGNLLSGDLGYFFSVLPSAANGNSYISLREINVGSNNFTGSIPSMVNVFYGLTNLGLNDNHLDGDLSAFSVLTRSEAGFDSFNMVLQVLNMANNNLSGPIDDLSSLLALELLLLTGNPYLNTSVAGVLPSFLVPSSGRAETIGAFACPVITGAYTGMYVSINASVYDYSLCTCVDGFYGLNGVCQACPETCTCFGHTVSRCYPSNITAGPGPYTQDGVQLVEFMACASGSKDFTACNPTVSSEFGCAEGYTGRACLVCEDGYYPEGVFCYPCSFLRSTFYFSLYFSFHIFNAWTMYAWPYSPMYRIFVTYGQSLFILLRPAMPWPQWFGEILHVVTSTLNYNVLALTCGLGGSSRFYLSLTFAIAQMFIFVVVGLGVAIVVGSIDGSDWLYDMKRALVLAFLQINFFTALLAFQALPWACQKDPGDLVRFMRAFPDINCDSKEGHIMESVAWILSGMVAFTPITLLYFMGRYNAFAAELTMVKWVQNAWVYGLVKDALPRALKADPRDRGGGSLGVLVAPFVDTLWYWELVILFRKLAFASCIAFVPSLNDQIIFLFIVLILIFVVAIQSSFLPYAKKIHNVVETLTLSAMTVAVRAGMLSGSSFTSNGELEAAGSLAMLVLLLGFVLFPIVIVVKARRKKVKARKKLAASMTNDERGDYRPVNEESEELETVVGDNEEIQPFNLNGSTGSLDLNFSSLVPASGNYGPSLNASFTTATPTSHYFSSNVSGNNNSANYSGSSSGFGTSRVKRVSPYKY